MIHAAASRKNEEKTMSLIQYTHRGMTPWFDDMDRYFDEAFAPARSQAREGAWAPRVDISEDKGKIVLRADLPGVDEKDVSVKVEGSVLTVSGERKFEKETEQENFHRVERTYGTFTRSFTLPETVDTEKISAKYDKGVLHISIPKVETKPKTAKVIKIG
jgi:HSP20 family protein